MKRRSKSSYSSLRSLRRQKSHLRLIHQHKILSPLRLILTFLSSPTSPLSPNNATWPPISRNLPSFTYQIPLIMTQCRLPPVFYANSSKFQTGRDGPWDRHRCTMQLLMHMCLSKYSVNRWSELKVPAMTLLRTEMWNSLTIKIRWSLMR